MNNLVIIGVWYYSKRLYIPHIFNNQKKFIVTTISWVDLLSQKEKIESYLLEKGILNFDISYIEDTRKNDQLYVESIVVNHIKKNMINCMVISTEPLFHWVYSQIALKNNLSIILDKPITLEKDMANISRKSDNLITDYNDLCDKFRQNTKGVSWVHFDVMVQRRHHKGYHLVKEKIDEIMDLFHCPITSMNAFSNDWQWRFPDEIINQNYHSYNEGYWKVWHSGFHIVDIVAFLLMSTSIWEKKIVWWEVFSSGVFPEDVVSQFNFDDYENAFPGYSLREKYSESGFMKKVKDFWEIDISSIITLKNSLWKQTLLSINQWHNWLSCRSWDTADWRDLYKWNGRIRQEHITIEQWPFQSIFIETFKSWNYWDQDSKQTMHWWENHFDIHIHRNKNMNEKWKSYEMVSWKELYGRIDDSYNYKSSKDWIDLFFYNINNKISWEKSFSNILDFNLSIQMFSSIYKSLALKHEGENPIVNFDI